MPKVSIIIPVYNAERYIDRCVESVLRQTIQDIEVLLLVGICDDASADKCREWQKKDVRVRVKVKRLGCAAARNLGLKMADGKYIAYVDADDYVDTHFLEYMIEPLEKDDDIDVACCGFARFGRGGIREEILPRYTGRVESRTFSDYYSVIGYGVVWLRVYRREWLIRKNMEMFDGGHEDDAMVLMMAAQVKSVFYVKKALYFYNTENEGSMMHCPETHYDYCNALAYAVDYLKKEQLFDQYRIDVRRCCVEGIHGMDKYIENHERFQKITTEFWGKYFPEVLEEIRYKKQHSLKIKDRLVLFGAGADGRHFLEKHPDIELAYIVDNNCQIPHSYIGKYEICGFERLLREDDEVTVIVSSRNYYYEIAGQLRESGIFNYVSMNEYLSCPSS